MPLSAGSAARRRHDLEGCGRSSTTVVNFLHTPADLRGRESGGAARGGGLGGAAARGRAGSARHPRPGADGGRLVRLHRGVYAVGHSQLTPLGWRWAAVLGVRRPRRARRSATGAPPRSGTCFLHPRSSTSRTLAAARSTATIRVHRRRHADARGPHALVDGLPLTTVARTLVDLTSTLTPHQTERVVHRAEHLRLLDTRSLDAQLARAQGRRRGSCGRRWNAAAAEPDITRTELEERFLALILNAQCYRGPRSTRSSVPTRSTSSGAPSSADRGDRRPGHPPDAASLRGRPPPRRAPLDAGVQNPPLHLAAGRLRARLRGQGHSHSTPGVACRPWTPTSRSPSTAPSTSLTVDTRTTPARPPARAPRAHGREEGLRPRPVRRVHDPASTAAARTRCLALAVAHDGAELTTVEGLGERRRAAPAAGRVHRARRASSAATARPASCARRSG